MPTQNTPFPIPYPPFDPHRCSRAEIRAAQHLKEDYAREIRLAGSRKRL